MESSRLQPGSIPMRPDQRSNLHIVGNGVGNEASELERILNDLHELRRHVVEGWQSRAVLLTLEERRELRDAIRETCELLEEITVTP
jgi:hypothetical protein